MSKLEQAVEIKSATPEIPLTEPTRKEEIDLPERRPTRVPTPNEPIRQPNTPAPIRR